MVLSSKTTHPMGRPTAVSKSSTLPSSIVDTYGGKVHIDWNPEASVTPLGQLPFFIQFLKLGGRFDPWVKECPLHFTSNNAPKKVDVLGSLFLSILSGHRRYSHITTLMSDTVNPELLGMNKIVSEDSARRAVKKIDGERGIIWLKNHLLDSCKPLLKTAWILDIDTTIKPLYGHQEDAVIAYNPQKPGRPSHTYHTYMIGNLRLVLDIELKAGNESHSNHSLPGLLSLLQSLGVDEKPELVRGDIGFGTDAVMRELEAINQPYLFKLKKSRNVSNLLYKHHSLGEWINVHPGWEAKSDELLLQGWEQKRRVVIVRRRLNSRHILGAESAHQEYKQLTLFDEPEDLKIYEYSVLVSNQKERDLVSLFHYYRDRADCENNFDELKNQWGWGGYTSRDVKSCRLMSRMIGLIYNWWNLYVRLAIPEKHHEAITSRPLLLTGIGRQTKHSAKKTITVTSMHGKSGKLEKAYHRLSGYFDELKENAPQLSLRECWQYFLQKIIDHFEKKSGLSDPPESCLASN